MLVVAGKWASELDRKRCSMNDFKKANVSLTHAKIVNEYENKVQDLEREIERLKAYKDKQQSKVNKSRYYIGNITFSLRIRLKSEPDTYKRELLELLTELQEELK